jgi:hypothetical protein
MRKILILTASLLFVGALSHAADTEYSNSTTTETTKEKKNGPMSKSTETDTEMKNEKKIAP